MKNGVVESSLAKWRNVTREGVETQGVTTFRTKTLSGVYTTNGDYHTPTTHAYVMTYNQRGYGSTVKRYPDGKQDVKSGNIGFVSSWSNPGPSGFDSAVRDRAIVSFYEKVRNSDLDITTDLVQYRQTFDMVSEWKRGTVRSIAHARHMMPTAQRAQNALDVLNRRDLHRDERARRVRELDRSLNTLANARLQYVYGVKPTAMTISELASVIKVPPVQQGFIKVVAQKSYKYPFERRSPDAIPLRSSGWYREYCKIVGYYSPTNDALEGLTAIATLNPVSLFYEMVPYSFVIDWFSTTGGWIKHFETALTHRNNFVSGYQLQGLIWVDHREQTGKAGLEEYTIRGMLTQKRFRRTRLTSPPVALLPRLEMNFGLSQLLTATALVKQRFSLFDKLLSFRRS